MSIEARIFYPQQNLNSWRSNGFELQIAFFRGQGQPDDSIGSAFSDQQIDTGNYCQYQQNTNDCNVNEFVFHGRMRLDISYISKGDS